MISASGLALPFFQVRYDPDRDCHCPRRALAATLVGYASPLLLARVAADGLRSRAFFPTPPTVPESVKSGLWLSYKMD